MENKEKSKFSGWKNPWLTTTILSLAALAIGALLAWWIVSRADTGMRTDLLQETKLIAQALNLDRIKALSGSVTDLKKPEYLRIRDQLNIACSAMTRCSSVYVTGRKSDGTVFFFVDSRPNDQQNHFSPGQTYAEASMNHRRVFSTGASIVEGPVTDREGVWVTGYVPIFDSRRGTAAFITPDDAQAMVQKAISYYRKKGRQHLLTEINNPLSKFSKGDLYVFAYDLSMTLLAHPVKPELVGQNLLDEKDWAGGKPFRREIRDIALSRGSGWVDYEYDNPVRHVIEPKTTYVEKVDDLIICAGAYKGNASAIAVLSMNRAADSWNLLLVRAALPSILFTLFLIAILWTARYFLSQRSRISGTPAIWLRHLETILAAAIGISLTLFAAWTAHERENFNRNNSFRQLAYSQTENIAEVLRNARGTEIEGLANFYESSKEVTPEEFRSFTRYLVKNSAVHAWEWIQAVPASKKAGFEAAARKAGLKGFAIWQKDTQGNRVPASGRTIYYPVLNVAPFSGNEQSIGYDQGSEPLRQAAMERAARTGLVTGTKTITLIQEAGSQKSMLIYRPVFTDNDSRHLRGFATAALRMETLLKNASPDTSAHLELLLLQKNAPPELLASGWDIANVKATELSAVRPVFAFGNVFGVIAYAGPKFLKMHPRRAGWFIILLGFLLTAAVTVIISVLSRRREKLEILVERQTRELRDSESLQRLLLDNLPAGVIIVDPQTRIIERVNNYVADLYGASVDHLLGHRCHLLLCPAMEGTCPVCDLGKTVDNSERELLRADGSRLPILKTVTWIQLNDQEKLLECFVDISEQKKAENALREKTALLSGLLASIPDIIFFKNKQGVYLGCNPEFARFVGKDISVIIGATDYDLFSKDVADFFREQDKIMMDRGEPWRNEEWIEYPDGTRVLIETLKAPLRDTEGQIIGLLGVSRDITKRKTAEEENIRLASIVASTDDAIIGINLDGSITSWNRGAEKMYGYTVDEVSGRHISVLVPSDKIGEQNEVIAKIKNGQRVEHLETVRLKKDGRPVIVSLSISPIENTEGRITGISAIARDITRQKQAEAELRKLSRAVQESPASVVITDTRGNINYVNPKFTRTTGYSLQEVMGQNPRVLKSGETTPADYQELWDTITSGREWRGIFHNKKKNGELYWESASISPIKDEHGVITDFIAVKEDITAMKYAQDELAKLSLVASKTDNAVIITNNQGLIEWVNDGFTRMTGYTLSEILGKKPGPILQGPLTNPETVKRISDKLKKKEPFTEEILNYYKNGETKWISMDITPIRNDQGEVVKFISLQRDITQRKETEEALRQAKAQAESANQAKSEFLANMSHEIRTPMNAIIGIADLLWDSDLTPEQRQYVQISRSAGENLLLLINDILDLSKVEAGQLALEHISFDLFGIIEKTCEVMAVRTHSRNLELACRISPDTPQYIKGDPTRLRQVITNLLCNAIKFTEKGEIVLMVLPTGKEISSQSPQYLQFSVRDTGIGIPAEKLSTIFEKFTQADSSITRKYAGTGLGLAISRQLTELMGGKIWVESKPQEGSTFFFTIPLEIAPPEEKQEATVTAPEISLQGWKILVVDDNTTNRLILRETLTQWGCKIVEAPGGAAGLAELIRAKNEGAPFQIALLDCRMPEMDGFTLAQEIRNNPDFSSLSIIMLTSENRSSDLTRAKDMNFEAYLIKPVKRQALKESLQAIAGKKKVPLKQQTASAGEPLPEIHPLNILLVEDTEDNRFLILAYLKNTPYRVDTAENGKVALEKFLANTYDLILMDMQMPVMDGYTATREIRSHEQKEGRKSTPIIALTAYALKEELQKSITAGCDAHLTKPIKKQLLLEAIQKYAASGIVPGKSS
jgi:PAS domain S-box-containing protein